MLPLPQRIDEIVCAAPTGVCLARTATGFFIVGLDYTQGAMLKTWNPSMDFYSSRDQQAALRKYLEYTGVTPRTPS